MTLFNIFLSDTTWDFALEIIIRCVVMYLIIHTKFFSVVIPTELSTASFKKIHPRWV